MKRIKFAILGLGRIGRLHADTIITNPNSELVSINDPKNNEINNLKKKYLCPVMSIDDIVTESTMSFVAKSIKEQHRFDPTQISTLPVDYTSPGISASSIVEKRSNARKGYS